jgi:acyl-CoA synthetase (AMP-forming)/AMP-acid ligase II
MTTAWREALASEYRRIEATPLPETVPALLEQAARRFGTGTAIDFFEDGESLSFVALRDRVRRLASSLHRLGVQKGTHVAVAMPNRIEFPVTWLALAELGAVMVPIGPSVVSRELAYYYDDGDVTHAVLDASLTGVHESIAADERPPAENVVVVGECRPYPSFADLMAAGDPQFLSPQPPTRGDLLNIQYTSGTTGMPKGVMQTHRFWVVCGCLPTLLFRDSIRRILAEHPFHYMDPQWMLIMGLHSGARVDFTRGMSVRRFMEWLHTRGSELVWFADPLLKTPPSPRDRETSAKLFLAYNFSREMIESAEARYGVRTREFYGMTEIGPALMVPYELADASLLGTCGLPVPFRECRIVDENGRDVAPGEPGELWVRGDSILDGYYKRPDVNARLLTDGWFHTGDLFVQDATGAYRIVGRLKDMIKRSGENVSALEVERVLLELPAIREAAVVPVPDSHRDEEVKAYVQLRDGQAREHTSPDQILEHCRARLAKFKLPRYLEYVDEFEYTPSGKVAKHLLLKQKSDLREDSYDFVDAVWR